MLELDGLPPTVIAKVTGKAKRKQGERYSYVTYQREYRYAGVLYPINSAKSGCYTDILQRIIEQILLMKSHYGRVLFVRLDLHHQHFGEDNELVSAFIKSARAFVQRRYQTRHLGFVWVREQERAKQQHYHLTLMIDGDVVRHPANLFKVLNESWQRRGGTLSIPKNPFIFIDNEDTLRTAIERASYLAKARGKGYQQGGAHNFGCSQIGPTLCE
ncbi:YagK/YfjJ domain-containing protein [Aeromonas media]|uniref:YagK/YfjJ domain-containing protein n=1 Tax=Aeromonas media TaxID=651 RepID=UPI003D22C782